MLFSLVNILILFHSNATNQLTMYIYMYTKRIEKQNHSLKDVQFIKRLYKSLMTSRTIMLGRITLLQSTRLYETGLQ